MCNSLLSYRDCYIRLHRLKNLCHQETHSWPPFIVIIYPLPSVGILAYIIHTKIHEGYAYFIYSCTATKTSTVCIYTAIFCRIRCRCGLLYLKVPYLLQQNYIPRTAGWQEVTSKYESTFCHQTVKAKSDFCDHEAATPLFIEIADIHIYSYFVHLWKDGGHVFRWRGFWNLNWTSENIISVYCQCNSNGSQMPEMSLLLLSIYKRTLLKHSPRTYNAAPDLEHMKHVPPIQSMPAVA